MDTGKTVEAGDSAAGIAGDAAAGTTATGEATGAAGEATEAAGEATEAAGETAARIYLGASAPENYVYTILAGQKLTMNDIYYNDVPIKWEWVYDMVGYYFRGTINPSAEIAIDLIEYVRPIEYDYSKAVFETDIDTAKTVHQLLQVDGVSVADFLTEISAEDGYMGTIDATKAVAVGNQIYYPVQVDGNGYGVWAYLCTLEEVEAGIAYDTALANST